MSACREFDGRRCPQCGSILLTNGEYVWCSFVGGRNEKACRFGIGGAPGGDWVRVSEFEAERAKIEAEQLQATEQRHASLNAKTAAIDAIVATAANRLGQFEGEPAPTLESFIETMAEQREEMIRELPNCDGTARDLFSSMLITTYVAYRMRTVDPRLKTQQLADDIFRILIRCMELLEIELRKESEKESPNRG